MKYTNSNLVSCTRLSPNHSGQRTHEIDRITPHCVVGQATAERIGEIFAPTSRQASCNYGIGRDGRIVLVVEEKNRSWCSSSRENDQRAITIEVASDSTHPYAFRDEAYAALINLCIDICKRYGKKKLLWLADKARTLAYEPKTDEMVLSVHRWFANKSCPGDWMYARMGELASKVTAALSGNSPEQPTAPDQPAVKEGLSKGDKGDAVRQMQTMLIACGYSCGSTGADGDFGKNTLAGLLAFQTAAGLTADGVYGEVDKAALEGKYKEAQQKEDVKTDEQVIWDTLMAAIQNPYGVAGLMGNLKAESNLHANNLQNNGNTKLGMTDEEFTAAFDSGAYPLDTFIHDGYGYGLAQWTYYSRKAALAAYALDRSVSIGDLSMQLGFLLQEIKGYKTVWNTLVSATSVREASDAVLLKFERPADQSEAVQKKRAAYGQTYYDKYGSSAPEQKQEQKQDEQKPEEQKQEQTVEITATQAKYINSTGTHWISNSGSDERGQYTGGQAGDQTGKEWRMRDWYNRPWSCVLRYLDQRVALKIAQLAIDAALNDKIGYDQSQNRTYLKQLKAVGWEPSKITVACEADCSAGVCANVTAAGYLLGIPALQNHTGTYTGNMRKALVKAGFKELTDSKYLTSGDYLLPGDILLLESHHTATNATIGKKVRGDWNPGKAVTPTTPDTPTPTPDTPTTTYYRVRKSWSDKASQIGAFTVFQNAKNCVDANPGYAAFDDNGNQLYPTASFQPYSVLVSIPDLNYRKGPGVENESYGYIEPGTYTIVDEQDGWGLLKAYEAQRNGWIKLSYTSKV